LIMLQLGKEEMRRRTELKISGIDTGPDR